MTDTHASVFEGLNEAQCEAVTTVDGPVLVVAGPGTGKTLTIVRRIAYLLHGGAKPDTVLAVTFTNRAAQEMRERMESLLGPESEGVFVGTFHLLGLMILREALCDGFVVYSKEEQLNVVKGLCKEGASQSRELVDSISRIKSLLETPSEEMRHVYEAYEAALRDKGAMDFDDLILRPIELLENPRFVSGYRERFRHIIVDEYQDINAAQYRLLRLLARDRAGMCGVGDPDQAIYAFRGADVGNFLRFGDDFPNGRTVALKRNYRSTGMILDGASTLIRNNGRRIEKDVQPTKGTGERIRVVCVPDERAEGRVIVSEIEHRIGGTSHYRLPRGGGRRQGADESYGFSDFAVMFRTNGQAKAIEEAFLVSGIPCRVVGSRSTGALNGSDVIGKIKAFAEAECPPDMLRSLSAGEFLEVALKKLNIAGAAGYQEIVNYINMVEGDGGVNRRAIDFLKTVSLLTNDDSFDARADAVTLMTLHMGKGLEFKVVFIVGCEEGLMPFGPAEGPADIEEERRLFYVGMTRAREELFLLSARTRFLYGNRCNRRPSPFLGEIPGRCVEERFVPDRPGKQKRKRQMELF